MIPALVAAIGVGGALFFATSTAIGALTRGRATTLARLGAISGEAAGTMLPRSPGREGLLRVGVLDRRIARAPFGATLKQDLRRAGLAWQVKDYAGIILMVGLFGGVIGLMLANTLVAMLGMVVGILLPVLLVKRSGAGRATRLNGQIVDLIDLLASSLRSGFGFMQSLELASREQADPLAAELRHTIREMNLGMGTDEALDRLAVRTGDDDLKLVVTAVLIQRRVGGNLGEVLENIAALIRDRGRVRGEIKTLTAQVRLSSWIVGLLPVVLALALSVIQPGYMGVLFSEPVGRVLLGMAGTFELIGFFIVRRIGAIDY